MPKVCSRFALESVVFRESCADERRRGVLQRGGERYARAPRKRKEEWLCLYEQNDTFETPNSRGSWTRRIELVDAAVAPDHILSQLEGRLQEAANQHGMNAFISWATEAAPQTVASPPRSPRFVFV